MARRTVQFCRPGLDEGAFDPDDDNDQDPMWPRDPLGNPPNDEEFMGLFASETKTILRSMP
jgi:hypothetical protein